MISRIHRIAIEAAAMSETSSPSFT
jgi:hypothetical protein